VTSNVPKLAELNEKVRRLAQYRPFEGGGRDLLAALADLVLAATELNGGKFDSLEECRRAMRDLWTVDVEIDEIREVRDALIASKGAKSRGGGFELTAEARDELQRKAQAAETSEAKALSEWQTATREARPDLTAGDLEHLCEDLEEWLGKIIVRHGAEAALILYPEDQRAQRLFQQIDDLGTDFLPLRSASVMAIRDAALKDFVRRPSPEQRSLLANRLNTAFYLTVLTLDPEARPLAEKRARGTRIYLDTNFLYPVLGMGSPQEVLSARRLLEITEELGYQLAVTRWTIDEMHYSIERGRKEVEESGRTMNEGLATLMIHATGEKGVTRAYWASLADHGLSPKDFFEKISAFEEDLPSLGIDVVDEGCRNVEKQEEVVQEYTDLLKRIVWPQDRHPEVLEHDAKHRLLVQRLRGSGAARFSTAKCWFLTQDSKLPAFARQEPDPDKVAPKLPFCISPSAWIQVVRAMTPRTENYEQMVVELLASPFVGYRGSLNQRAVREVVARMDHYEDASPDLALAVIEDSALMEEIEKTSDEDMAAAVKAAYSSKAQELKEQAEESARIAAAEQAAREQAEKQAEKIRQDLEAERRQRERIESEAESSDRKLRTLSEERQAEAENHSSEVEALREEHGAEIRTLRQKLDEEREGNEEREQRQKRNRRIAAGATLGALGPIILAAVLALGLIHGSAAVLITAIAGAAMFGIGLNLALGAEKGGATLNFIAYLLSVAGIVTAIIATHSS
jgi:hypothetical protein